MKTYILSKEKFAEVSRLCTYLYVYHYELAASANHYPDEDYRTRKLSVIQFAEVTEYHPDSAENNFRYYKIGSNYYEVFRNKFNLLRRSHEQTEQDKIELLKFDELDESITLVRTKGTLNASIVAQFSGQRWYVYDRWINHINRRFLVFKDVVDNKMSLELSYSESADQTKILKMYGIGYVDSSGDFLVLEFKSEETNALPTCFLIKIGNDIQY